MQNVEKDPLIGKRFGKWTVLYRDLTKEEYCLKNDVKLLRIPYCLKNEEIKTNIINFIQNPVTTTII